MAIEVSYVVLDLGDHKEKSVFNVSSYTDTGERDDNGNEIMEVNLIYPHGLPREHLSKAHHPSLVRIEGRTMSLSTDDPYFRAGREYGVFCYEDGTFVGRGRAVKDDPFKLIVPIVRDNDTHVVVKDHPPATSK